MLCLIKDNGDILYGLASEFLIGAFIIYLYVINNYPVNFIKQIFYFYYKLKCLLQSIDVKGKSEKYIYEYKKYWRVFLQSSFREEHTLWKTPLFRGGNRQTQE